MKHVKKISVAGMLVALGVICSVFYIPVGAAKCFPVQHMINVIAAVFLGPAYGIAMAFATSTIRILLGTGSFLAYPGSMVGALLSGLLYKRFSKLAFAYTGEIIGTGILGALLAFPVATLFMSKEAAVFTYLIPFMVSSFGGATISVILLNILTRAKVLDQLKHTLQS